MPDDQAYTRAFEVFLATTNEKKVLLEELQKIIKEDNVQSLLDIGPGNGDLSIPLSREVEHYVGVEPIDVYAQKLQAAGLHIINQPFPADILEHFDMVLACHVISFTDTDIPEFLNAAWERIVSGGTMVVVTHSGAESDWGRLTATLEQKDLPYHRAVFERIRQLLDERGKMELRTVKTTVESDSKGQMIEALGFVWSDGEPQKFSEFMSHKESVAAFLDQSYVNQSHYLFPFEHTFIIATKP